eukprot:9356-Amphidinium_carterae.2
MAVHTVWTDGSGRHTSNPHFRRCGVGYVTDTGERAWLPSGQRQPKGRHRDLEVQEADKVANPGAAAHAEHEPTAEYLRWELVAQVVRVCWRLVAPKL